MIIIVDLVGSTQPNTNVIRAQVLYKIYILVVFIYI